MRKAKNRAIHPRVSGQTHSMQQVDSCLCWRTDIRRHPVKLKFVLELAFGRFPEAKAEKFPVKALTKISIGTSASGALWTGFACFGNFRLAGWLAGFGLSYLTNALSQPETKAKGQFVQARGPRGETDPKTMFGWLFIEDGIWATTRDTPEKGKTILGGKNWLVRLHPRHEQKIAS